MAVARAVHGLDAEFFLGVRPLEPVHVIVKLVVVTRALKKFRAEELGCDDFLIAVLRIEIPNEVAQAVVHGHALGQVERRAGR